MYFDRNTSQQNICELILNYFTKSLHEQGEKFIKELYY